MNVTILETPVCEPVSLEQVKLYLKLDEDYEDQLLEFLVSTSREVVEQYTGCALITQTRRVLISQQDLKKNIATLPGTPFQELVTSPILIRGREHIDLTSYHLLHGKSQVRFKLKSYLSEGELIQIDYRCGYGENPDSTPAPLRQAVQLLACWLFETRGEDTNSYPSSFRRLVDPYRTIHMC